MRKATRNDYDNKGLADYYCMYLTYDSESTTLLLPACLLGVLGLGVDGFWVVVVFEGD